MLTLEELDVHSAVLLAHFQLFVAQTFGNAATAFRSLDRTKTKKLRRGEFVRALQDFGFKYRAKTLFHGLQRDGRDYLVEEDVLFLDRWRPPAFLVAKPDEDAKEEFRTLLLATYGSYMKAWRRCLDVDDSNHCEWKEFTNACKKVNFLGNVPGVWRALDIDHSGSITFREIDRDSFDIIDSYRQWAEEEFGSSASRTLQGGAAARARRQSPWVRA